MHQDQVHISGSFGISYMDLSASLAATGNVLDSNMMPVLVRVEEEANIVLPVPLVGVQIDIAPHRRVALQLFTRFFFIDGFGIRGGVTETAINLTWFVSRHFGFGGGLSRNSINIAEYESGDTKARFTYDIHGVTGFLKFAF